MKKDSPPTLSTPLARAFFTLRAEDEALKGLKSLSKKGFLKTIEILRLRTGKIITTGVGKSGFIAEKIAATLTSLGHQSFYLDPLNALHGDVGVVSSGDCLLALSFSGESPELLKLLRHLKKDSSISILSITGNKKSLLAHLSDGSLSFSITHEGSPLGLAPMASTTTSLVLGDMLASALTDPKNFEKKHFAKFHPAGSLGLSLKKVSQAMVRGKEIPCIKESKLFSEALQEMTDKRLGVTAVVTISGKLVGAITDGDVRRILLKHRNPMDMEVGKLMTPRPKSILSEASLKEALVLMEKHKITTLFVVGKGERLLGLLHMHSILEDFSKGN